MKSVATVRFEVYFSLHGNVCSFDTRDHGSANPLSRLRISVTVCTLYTSMAMIINYSRTRRPNLERTARIMRARLPICIFKRCVRRGDYATNRAHVPMTMYARHCTKLSSRRRRNMLIDLINGLKRCTVLPPMAGRVQISPARIFVYSEINRERRTVYLRGFKRGKIRVLDFNAFEVFG